MGSTSAGTKIQTVIVDEDHKVLGQARRPTPTVGGPKDVAKEMAQAMRDAARAAELDADGDLPLNGIGVGSPGVIEGGDVSTARNLPGWEGRFALAEALESALGPEVKVGNDVQVATDAEFKLGAGAPYESLIGVFWGTGVGAGLILDGEPWLGRGGAGEIGHMVGRDRRRALHLRAPRVRGGVRRPLGDGDTRAQAARAGQADRSVQADEGARAHPSDKRHLGAGPSSTRTSSRQS